MEKKDQKVIVERYLNIEIVGGVVIVREQVVPNMPPKVVFCGSKKEFADFVGTM